MFLFLELSFNKNLLLCGFVVLLIHAGEKGQNMTLDHKHSTNCLLNDHIQWLINSLAF